MIQKNKGLGDTQESDFKKARGKILEALSDGKRHRYNELLNKTKLSSATLTKHLKNLEPLLISRILDDTSQEYPPPVYYTFNFAKISPKIPPFDEFFKKTRVNVESARENFERTLDPEIFFLIMNYWINFSFITLSWTIQGLHNEEPDRDISTLIDIFVKSNIDLFAKRFAEIVLKHGEKLDFNVFYDQLLIRYKKEAKKRGVE